MVIAPLVNEFLIDEPIAKPASRQSQSILSRPGLMFPIAVKTRSSDPAILLLALHRGGTIIEFSVS